MKTRDGWTKGFAYLPHRASLAADGPYPDGPYRWVWLKPVEYKCVGNAMETGTIYRIPQLEQEESVKQQKLSPSMPSSPSSYRRSGSKRVLDISPVAVGANASVDMGPGLMTGLVVGALLAGDGCDEAKASTPEDTPTPVDPGGGDFGGAGASADYSGGGGSE